MLVLSVLLFACRSASVEAQASGEFGPMRILLYAEVKEATHGWLGDKPVPANIEAVSYRDSANVQELQSALYASIDANAEGQRKAVSAVVTWRRIEGREFRGVQIRSLKDIRIVDLPDELYQAWKAVIAPPPLEE